ncbi:unnamed protein product [Protopolystoma xenopodis]|uniref:Uncharacterized protein n=1 Tax=Protopolystoma xenopodis TaxID=117903 RepID=A0A3S5AJZ3_9PLAT|nr:unnamed protein product [Protopolystoma xenopodis]
MIFANRMLCGFCSKEQAYSSAGSCIECKRSILGGSNTTHWEGGKGCRNKNRMSRKDPKKYSNQAKTIPKKNTGQKKAGRTK